MSDKVAAAVFVQGTGSFGEPGYVGVKLEVGEDQYGFVLSPESLRSLCLVIDEKALGDRRAKLYFEADHLQDGNSPAPIVPA